MSDAGLRGAERRFRATGAAGDEAAYLLGRLRAGRLSRRALALAACCGHEPARVALGGPGGRWEEAEQPDSLDEVVVALGRWGRGVEVRAAAAAARCGLSVWGGAGGSSAGLLRRALRAAELWLGCPCELHGAEADDAGDGAWDVGYGLDPRAMDPGQRAPGDLWDPDPLCHAAAACAYAAWAVLGRSLGSRGRRPSHPAAEAVVEASCAVGEARVREVVLGTVIRGALG